MHDSNRLQHTLRGYAAQRAGLPLMLSRARPGFDRRPIP